MKRLIGFSIVILLLGLAACAPPTTEPIPVRETPTAESEPIATAESETEGSSEEIQADCFQSATAFAWLDENGNGVQDEGERPLPGIEFVLEPTAYSRTTTDENGIAAIFATSPGGCLELPKLMVAQHDGYVLTTASVVENLDPDETYAFGFQAETAVSSSDLFVAGENGLAFSSVSPVTAVNYLFTWVGESEPIYEYEQIPVANGRFQHGSKGDVTAQVEQLVASLTALTPADSIRYTNLWTDDYPDWHIEIQLADGRSLLLYSQSTGFRGHAPWYIMADGQLYRQTSGDIGFAVYDLLTEEAQDYFSLDQQAFDEALLESSERATIYYRLPSQFFGLLPLASSLKYEVDLANAIFSGTFVANYDWGQEFDNSSNPIQTVRQMQVGSADEMQLCTLESAVSEYGYVTWSFSCPLPAANGLGTLQIAVDFEAVNGGEFTSTGQIPLQTQ